MFILSFTIGLEGLVGTCIINSILKSSDQILDILKMIWYWRQVITYIIIIAIIKNQAIFRFHACKMHHRSHNKNIKCEATFNILLFTYLIKEILSKACNHAIRFKSNWFLMSKSDYFHAITSKKSVQKKNCTILTRSFYSSLDLPR